MANILLGTICTFLVSTCCVLALPYPRQNLYYSALEVPVVPIAVNPWEEALDDPTLFDLDAAYQVADPLAWMDVDMDALTEADYLEDEPRFQVPVFGQINYGEPAEEELRALKRSGPVRGSGKDSSKQGERRPAKTPKANQFLNEASSSQFPASKGQKEVAMLRPPNKSRPAKVQTTTTTAAPSTEPTAITSSSGERQKKPSAYDTLRKYLSIEDAMKKEAEKRRAESRHQKRSSSNIVAEEQALTNQLRGLKKHVA